MRAPVHLLAVLCLALAACIGGLDPPTIVVTPRILAMVGEPPEATPGEDIRVGVLAYDPEGRAVTYRWSACVGASELLGGSAGASMDPVCQPIPGDGPEAVIPGVFTAGIVENLDAVAAATGFPAEMLRAILATAGLAFEVHVEVVAPDGTVLVSGLKRVAITTRATPTTNPPALDYLVGDVAVRSAVPGVGDPFECLAARPITIHAGERIVLAARDTPEDWIETYPIFDFTGGVREGTENAYYSWYTTAGGLSAETTRLPDRDVFYRAPDAVGPQRLFFVLRDGHLGVRTCWLDVEITEPLPDPEP